jgi:predicted Holliday junction resolvase-like endonuclease
VATAKLMLILCLILAVIAFGLWRSQVRARSEIAGKSKELSDLRASLEDWRIGVESRAADSLEKQLSVFRTNELAAARELARKEYELLFAEQKSQLVATERADAIQRSRAVNRGLVAEQLAPHMAGFKYNPKDCSFLGRPCDYIVFDGLDAGVLKSIVFLEVKTGESQMNARERQVRDAVNDGRVSYEIYKLEAGDGTD